MTSVEAARKLLLGLIHGKHLLLQDIDDRMGHARGYLSRVLKGRARLTYQYLLEVLEQIDVDPAFFFLTLHPPKKERFVASARASGAMSLAQVYNLLDDLRGGLPSFLMEEAPAHSKRADLGERILAAIEAVVAEEVRPRSEEGSEGQAEKKSRAKEPAPPKS